MIRVFLTPPEFRHYSELISPPPVFRLPDHDTEAGQRTVKLAALASVIGMDRPRERIGDASFEVYGTRTSAMPRWQ